MIENYIEILKWESNLGYLWLRKFQKGSIDCLKQDSQYNKTEMWQDMTIHTHTLQGGDPIDTFLHQPKVVIAN